MSGLRAWFAALAARGEEVDVLYGRARDGSPTLEWLAVSHAEIDGVGGLGLVLSRQVGARIALPTHPPGYPGRGCAVGSTLALATAPGWPPARFRPATPPEVVWWSDDELEALRAVARHHGASVGSCLLWAAHRALAREAGLPRLLDGVWMVPVNLRRNPRPPHYYGNHASFLIGNPGRRSIAELDGDIADRLARGEHWGHAALLDKIARWPGADLGIDLLASAGLGFVGLFTNLGRWTVPEVSAESWCFAAPPTDATPIAIGVVCFNDRLAMSARSCVLGRGRLHRMLCACRTAIIGSGSVADSP